MRTIPLCLKCPFQYLCYSCPRKELEKATLKRKKKLRAYIIATLFIALLTLFSAPSYSGDCTAACGMELGICNSNCGEDDTECLVRCTESFSRCLMGCN